MKILSISTDKKLFEENSSILSRTILYASKVEEMHIVVFTRGGQKETTFGNLHLYPTNSFKFFSPSKAFKIAKYIINKNKLTPNDTVISTQDPFETGRIGLKLKNRFNLPLQVQIHTDFLTSEFKKEFLNKIRLHIAKKVLPKADGIRVVSEVIKSSIKQRFPKLKVEPDVLPVFVNIENIVNTTPKINLEKDFPQFKFIIFMASRLSKEKNIGLAVRALKEIIREFPQTGLIIAGSGSEEKKLRKFVRKMYLDKNVIFLGWQEDLISYFKTADMFLLTSDYEGYGMTLVEAGASGCPIVTTEVGLAKTDAFKNGENSFICSVGDLNCIQDSILTLIHDNSKRELFKHNIKESMKSAFLSKEEYVSKYISLLGNLLK